MQERRVLLIAILEAKCLLMTVPVLSTELRLSAEDIHTKSTSGVRSAAASEEALCLIWK